MNNKKNFLFEIMPSIRYLMSATMQMLLPFTSNEQIDNLAIVDKNKHRQLTEIHTRVAEEIILPIVTEKYETNDPISESDVTRFTFYCTEAVKLVRKDVDIQQFGRLNLDIYKKSIEHIKKQQRFSEKTKQSAIDMINILSDYTEIILEIMQNREEKLLQVFKEIDEADFLKSFYGTLLVFMCLNVILGISEIKDEKKFSIILDAGYEYYTDFDGYVDTIDILTSPKELELFRKTEKY